MIRRCASVMMLPVPRATGVLVLTWILMAPWFSAPARGQIQPAIKFTNLPPSGPGGPEKLAEIAGMVSGIPLGEAERYRVLVYAKADIWYIQPSAAEYYIPIDSKGRWETDSHFGRQYAALLVRRGYKPPITTANLPKIRGAVLDLTIRAGRPN